ncbi:MAG: hypothetical protein V8Q36_03230 [Anaerotignum sp.]
MALEMTKDTMTWKQRKGTHHSRILLEGDMIVPDNRPMWRRCSIAAVRYGWTR